MGDYFSAEGYIMYGKPELSYDTYFHYIGWLCHFSIYTLSDLGVLSNLIGSLSLANEH